MSCQTRCHFFSRRKHTKRAGKYKTAGSPPPSSSGYDMTDFPEDKQTLAKSASKGFMQSEEDLATFQPSAPVGAMEHQGKYRVSNH